MKKKKAALEAERKAKEKEAADKAPAGKGKKDAKKKKKWFRLTIYQSKITNSSNIIIGVQIQSSSPFFYVSRTSS